MELLKWKLIYNDRKQVSVCPKTGVKLDMNYKWAQGNIWDDQNVCYIHLGDGFTDVYISHNLPNCLFKYEQFIVLQLHLKLKIIDAVKNGISVLYISS